MLQVKLPVVDRIRPQNSKFAMGVENKATSDSKMQVTGRRLQVTGHFKERLFGSVRKTKTEDLRPCHAKFQ